MNYLDRVISAAATGALILTANKRLFRHLRDQFDQQMLAEGKSVWPTPQIFSYEGWLSRCLDELGEGWRLLSQQQQQCLWEEQIEKSSRGTSLELLQLSKTAAKAIQAHRLLNEYDLSLDGQHLTEDQLVFSRWQQRYKAKCQQHDWLDQSDLPRLICSALQEGKLDLPQPVLLVGFDQLSPGLLLLMQTINGTGGACDEVSLQAEHTAPVVCYAARDSEHEIESAARWARNLLDQGQESIGVVVPDLPMCRSQIERIFRQQIDPAATVISRTDEAIFSLSLGGSLAAQGVVHAALECLAVRRQLTLEQISFLLRTPYLAGALREADSRAFLDQKLRSFRQQTYKLARIKGLADEKSNLAIFSQLCGTLQYALQRDDKVLPGVWAARFADELFSLGWPGERATASSEFQAVKMWQEKALSALVTLDPIFVPIGRQRALNLLRRISQEIEFQLEGPTGALQVVGLLESSGLNFQHLWVMGLEETVLPACPQPNPFIPIKLQRDLEMPHASSARELQFAEQVIARLKSASGDVVFSYPLRDGDCDLRPSPLIPEYNPAVVPPLAEPQDLFSVLNSKQHTLDVLTDQRGPRLKQALVEGGTSLLQDQAHCPFRAFFHHRLHARQFAESAPGISPMVRGDLVHLVLELLWKKLQKQSHLLTLDESQCAELVQSLVTLAFETYFAHKPAPTGQLMLLEAERITALVQEWLVNVEMEREPFHVLETEQQHIEKIGPLQIRLQVDRIDQIENGDHIVVDYKTGSNLHPEDFLSQPLIEPQLPIYAVADPDVQVDGVVFAKLRRGECRFLGVVKEKGLLGKVREFTAYRRSIELGITTWEELLVFWRQQIDQLAADFVAGDAVVQPYDSLKSCQYCDLAGVCRVSESITAYGSPT